MEQGDLSLARFWFAAAVQRVPAYAPAQGHLAETEFALGEVDAAIARLRPLTASTDDPDYTAQLARILGETGQGEARAWRDRAAARYEELVARHPEAFADHAAEFWLTVGGDPARGLELARMNLAFRQTARAQELLARAALANADSPTVAGERNNDAISGRLR
jgi:hypothetical protein